MNKKNLQMIIALGVLVVAAVDHGARREEETGLEEGVGDHVEEASDEAQAACADRAHHEAQLTDR